MRHGTITFVGLSFALLAGQTLATEQMAVKEDLSCASCHSDSGFKRLTDQGKFYELMGSLDGYAEVVASFGRCTFCHRKKAGSKKLTKAGKGFATALGSMEALVDWVQDRHPGPPEPSGEVLKIEAGPKKPGGGESDGAPRPLPAH